jgi:hypothetical protein
VSLTCCLKMTLIAPSAVATTAANSVSDQRCSSRQPCMQARSTSRPHH